MCVVGCIWKDDDVTTVLSKVWVWHEASGHLPWDPGRLYFLLLHNIIVTCWQVSIVGAPCSNQTVADSAIFSCAKNASPARLSGWKVRVHCYIPQIATFKDRDWHRQELMGSWHRK